MGECVFVSMYVYRHACYTMCAYQRVYACAFFGLSAYSSTCATLWVVCHCVLVVSLCAW